MVGWGRVLATACRSGRIASRPGHGADPARLRQGPGGLVGPARQRTTTPGPRRRTPSSIDRAGPAGERHASTISISLDMKAAGRAIRAAGGGNEGPPPYSVRRWRPCSPPSGPPTSPPSDWLDARRPRADPALGVRPRRRWRARATRRHRPRPRHRRPRRRHRDLGQPAQRLRAPLRALDQRVAAVARLPRLPRARAAVLRRPADLHAALHADAHRPAPRATSARRRPSTSPTPPSGRRSARSRTPSRRAEYQDVLQQEADLTAGHGVLRVTGLVAVSAERSRRARARRRRDRAGRDPGLLRDPAALGSAGSSVHRRRAAAVPHRLTRGTSRT